MESMSKLGSGIWHGIHTRAKRAIDEPSKKIYEKDIKTTFYDLPCQDICAKDIWTWLIENPLSKYDNIVTNKGIQIGYFKHSWDMHNYVNRKLGKSIITFEDAYNIYYNRKIFTDIGSNTRIPQDEEKDCDKCGGTED